MTTRDMIREITELMQADRDLQYADAVEAVAEEWGMSGQELANRIQQTLDNQ